MSKKANPTIIGGFVLVAILVAILAVAFLASGEFFAERETFVSYFDESVDGLDVGASVKFRGIKFGEVEDIALFQGHDATQYAAITFWIDLKILRRLQIEIDFSDRASWRDVVESGLRSRLELASIVTGVVFIELEIKKDAGAPEFVNENGPYLEVPTTKSALSELGQSATEVVARLAAVDAPAIGDAAVTVLTTLNEKLEALDLTAVNVELVEAIAEVRRTVASSDLPAVTAELRSTLAEFREAGHTTNERLGSLLANMDSATTDMARALESLRASASNVDRTLAPDSDMMIAIQTAAEQNAQTMKSVKRLMDLLERNPRSLLTGRGKKE